MENVYTPVLTVVDITPQPVITAHLLCLYVVFRFLFITFIRKQLIINDFENVFCRLYICSGALLLFSFPHR